MFRSLQARLSASLLLLILLLAGFTSVVLFKTQRLYLAEVQQKVNLEVAEHIVAERLLFREDGQVESAALEHVFHMLMVVNPSIEVYLLDAEGRVLAHAAPEGRVIADRVPLHPVRELLRADAKLPILGLDPRHPDTRQPFSAARITAPTGQTGYLYVIVGSEPYQGAVEMLRGSYALRLGAVTLAAGLLAAAVVGMVFFVWQTRRLKAMSRAVDRFCANGFQSVVPVGESRQESDDFGRLQSSINDMMHRLVDQFDRLQRTDRERRELIAGISHDLRTPLASLQGYLETLRLKRRKLTTEERDRHVEVALRQAERLSVLVSQLFELSKLDSGHMEMHREVFPLAELVQDVTQKLEPAARAKDLHLEVSIPERPTPVYADIGLMERALTNLLDNAVKYSRHGGRVRVGLDVNGNGRDLEVTVLDDGPGIAPEDLSRIFEPFYRAPAAKQSDPEGSGLGLAIAQGILRLHDVVIRADSDPGQGTALRFEFPVHTSPLRA